MNGRPEQEGIHLLLDAVASEGDAVVLWPGDDVTDASLRQKLPTAWFELVRSCQLPSDFIDGWWASLAHALPHTVRLLRQRTSSIGLLTTRASVPSLVYCFGSDKRLLASRGFLPAYDAARTILRQSDLADEFANFYSVHDGFVDFFARDGGPLPVNEWRMVVVDPAIKPFLEFYTNGSDSAGFDLSVTPPTAYHLQPDEEIVAEIGDLWGWLDSQLANDLENLVDLT